jgi:NAD(P)-dependent dehydrogenase (short-subunit alcohol dehydrogenase family)
MEIQGTSAIVTGGASGLGEATARLLVASGARVVVTDLKEEAGEKLAAELGGRFVKADVADPDAVQAAVDAACELGPLRALVNCAGIGHASRTVDREGNPFDLKAFEFVLRVNLVGTFNCIRLAAVAMAKTDPLADGERGAIVNTASVAAFDGQIGQAAYSASKGGVVGMTLPIARDLSSIGVRVNTIAPGLIDTPIYGSGEGSDQFKAKLGQSVLFPKRLGLAPEFASMALELITNSYMNGETLRVDGGARLPPR